MTYLPKLFTVEVIAGQVGVRPETIRRAIRSGRMGCYRLGGCIRVSADQLAAYLEATLCPPREQRLPAAFMDTHEQTSAVADFQRGRRIRRALEAAAVELVPEDDGSAGARLKQRAASKA